MKGDLAALLHDYEEKHGMSCYLCGAHDDVKMHGTWRGMLYLCAPCRKANT